jgi:hypothetical protein
MMSINDFNSFIEWKDNQNKDYLGGKFMYDIKGYYKRLNESELFDYWLNYIHK